MRRAHPFPSSMNHCVLGAAIAVATLTLSGCGGDSSRKGTFPVTGTVMVDGSPADNLAVTATPISGMDKEAPTVTSAFTDAQGKFTFSTYETGDGIPSGQYALTFRWGQLNMLTMNYDGDKLNGRYNDPAKSEFKIEVGDGQPLDVGTFELKSKK